jgi:hypothetical protein
MPSSQEILDGLSAIANGWRALAIVWHIALAAMLIALVAGWRPAKPLAGALLAVPLVSVSFMAWFSGNPFNGTVFAIIAIALGGVALGLQHRSVQISGPGLFIPGVLLSAFGWAYPHFLHADSWATYLYAAPLGLIPCPTLSAVIGVALTVRGLGSRGYSLVLGLSGVLYGLIGWLRLGVAVDIVLLLGATALVVVAVSGLRHKNPAADAEA